MVVWDYLETAYSDHTQRALKVALAVADQKVTEVQQWVEAEVDQEVPHSAKVVSSSQAAAQLVSFQLEVLVLTLAVSNRP